MLTKKQLSAKKQLSSMSIDELLLLINNLKDENASLLNELVELKDSNDDSDDDFECHCDIDEECPACCEYSDTPAIDLLDGIYEKLDEHTSLLNQILASIKLNK